MTNNVSQKLHQTGLHPIIKYHQMYNYLMNPMTNPYLQMKITNKMMAPNQMMANDTFVGMEKNLHDFADVYAKSLANIKSGLFGDPEKTEF